MTMTINPLLLKDFYKADHKRQYPPGTTMVYSNWTPRSSRIPGSSEVVLFGLQAFMLEHLVGTFERDFFRRPRQYAVRTYKRMMDGTLGVDAIPVDHIGALHELGYLPIRIKAVPEGTAVPLGVPMFTVVNTLPQFYWVTNLLETLISCEVWLPCTSATTAHRYRCVLDYYCALTGGDPTFVPWQGHDFSMRGMAGWRAACASGAAHLMSFTGTDTIPAIQFLEEYYGANVDEALVGSSVPATEHSVMCMGTHDDELSTYRRLVTDVYPEGVVSIVSDTWDLWKVLTEFMPALKEPIMTRSGKVVIRPDSGDPVKILVGDPEAKSEPARKGVVRLLHETFGGHKTSKGFLQLDPHVGAIYGDSITLDRCERICSGLSANGFASTNVVLGIGSFTYQYVTRDTYGFAMKATYGEVDGKPREIYKDPVTDNGSKRSARGLIQVYRDHTGGIHMRDRCTWEEERGGILEEVFVDGKVTKLHSIGDVRARLASVRERTVKQMLETADLC